MTVHPALLGQYRQQAFLRRACQGLGGLLLLAAPLAVLLLPDAELVQAVRAWVVGVSAALGGLVVLGLGHWVFQRHCDWLLRGSVLLRSVPGESLWFDRLLPPAIACLRPDAQATQVDTWHVHAGRWSLVGFPRMSADVALHRDPAAEAFAVMVIGERAYLVFRDPLAVFGRAPAGPAISA